MAVNAAGRETLHTLQKLLQLSASSKGFDRLLRKVQIVSGAPGQLTAVMKVEQEHQNRGGFLHGAMSACLVDCLSDLALRTHPKNQSPHSGVSVNINMTYIKAVPVGQEVEIKVSTDKMGKRLAFLTVDILNKETREILVKGSHTKFVG